MIRKSHAFARWLRQQRDRDDPVGDLAEDFAADPRARRIRTVAELAAHLSHSGACSEARFALREAAQEFRAHQLPRPPTPADGNLDDDDAVLEALAYLSDLHPDDAHDGVLIGARWYPRWRLEELADKYREPRGCV